MKFKILYFFKDKEFRIVVKMAKPRHNKLSFKIIKQYKVMFRETDKDLAMLLLLVNLKTLIFSKFGCG